MIKKHTWKSWLFAALFFIPFSANSQLNLSNVPLYLGGNVDPNIMFILDDSGSMMFETMPDSLTNMFSQACCTNYQMWVYPRVNGLHGDSDYVATRVPAFNQNSIMNRAYRSSSVNTLYYNPAITYLPWVNADGSSMPNANPVAAPNRPLFTEYGVRNLTINNTQNVPWMNDRSNSSTSESRTFYPAVYWTYTGPDINDLNAAILDGSSALWTTSNYVRTEIRASNAPFIGEGRENRTDCTAGSCTYQQEIQNFANWYTYHRNRIFAARAGIGRAFSTQSETMRIGFGAINKGVSNVDNVSTNTIINGVRPFTGSSRIAFYDELYKRAIPSLGTPLRRALGAAGEYYSRTDQRGPWSTTPGQTGGEDLMCRQSYTILMSDGAASGETANAATGNAAQNNDGTSNNSTTNVHPTDTNRNYSYSPADPFQDNLSGTLADVAMYYWKRDLRPDLDNKVPTSLINPAFWQHMVTYTIGLGVSGSVDPEDAFSAITSGTAINWGDPSYGSANCTGNACISRQDDFLHAAVNSRGGFFSAAEPDSFARELANMLSNIADRTSSASSVALNSGSISSESYVYQARFNSGDWSGQLLFYPLDTTTGGVYAPNKDTRTMIPSASNRTILTFDGHQGQPFRWNSISTPQQAYLGSEAVLNYLRGDASGERKNGGSFRNRQYLLGDIIHSAPTYVAAPSERYPDNLGGGSSSYQKFVKDNQNRRPVIYVGANDGMLHAFDASDPKVNPNAGTELFAYIPNAVYNNLRTLSDPNYVHRYFVDGSPTVVDAYLNNQWRTVLVSGLGAGGKSIFALDVTNPNNFLNEGTASHNVLWEFRDDDLGYSFGEPSIVRLQNGTWAAIFSGGYNSSSGNAVLFIVNLANGELIKKFDTHTDTSENPNGLSSPVVVDINGDYTADIIYAGDLHGNLWKINISHSNSDNWGFAYGSSQAPKPLYEAVSGDGRKQPISTRPQVVRHPSANGFLVLFGTGKYFENVDNSIVNQPTQSFYAIWDKPSDNLPTPFNRNNLQKQEISHEVIVQGSQYRVTSDKRVNWPTKYGWYIDLISPGSSENLGERQVSNAVVRNGRIIFTTLLPSNDPCADGGSSWLMELDVRTGSRLQYSPFDLNNDSQFNADDFVTITIVDEDGNEREIQVPVSGRKSNVGIISTPSIVSEAGGQREFKYFSGSSGDIEVVIENPGPGFEGRQSWRQLDFNFR